MNATVSDRVLSARAEAVELFLGTSGVALLPSSDPRTHNIQGVGIREHTISGYPTGEACVAIYALDPTQLNPPPKIQDVPVDVIKTEPAWGFSTQARHRPAPIGVSFGPAEEGPIGTLGFVGRHDGSRCVLGCNHVFARENTGADGDLLIQPALGDMGDPVDDAVAALAKWEDLDFGGPNRVDAAVAHFDHPGITQWIYDIGPMATTPCTPRLGLAVRKSGRTTGTRDGTITDLRVDRRYELKHGIVLVVDLVEVAGEDGMVFSWEGDSGALAVEPATRQPVGMVVGGNSQVTFLTRITRLLDLLGVSF